jgi:hypothetical protein
MQDLVAGPDWSACDPLRVTRRLTIVQMPLGYDLHDAVDVQINRVCAGGGHVLTKPSGNHPESRTEEIFAMDFGERQLKP